MYLRRSRQAGIRRAMVLAPFLLLLAMAPSALYIDHWADFVAGPEPHIEEITPHTKERGHGEQNVHNLHCHGSSGCADTSLPAGLDGVALEARLSGADLPTMLVGETSSSLEEFLSSPLTEPPRI